MRVLNFYIPEVPHAQQRMRFTKAGKTYSPNTAQEHWTIVHVQQDLPKGFELLTGPLWLDVDFYFHRPKAHFGTGRNAGKLKPSAPWYPHKVVKDLDNLVKNTADALNNIVYVDDRQIVRLTASKAYVNSPGSTVGTYIVIAELT